MRFILVGALSSLIYALIVAILVGGLDIAPKLASVFAYLGSLPLNFLANRGFAFRSEGTFHGDASRFVVMHTAGAAIAYGSMSLATDYLGSSYLIGIVFAVVLVPAFNFLLANFWVFRDQRTDSRVH